MMTNFHLRPRLGRVRGKADGRLLFVCYFDPSGIATVYEYVALWQHASQYQIEILNLWPSGVPLQKIALSEFDGCILHSTISYHPETLWSTDQHSKPRFADYDGVKVLIKQDEHRRANAIGEFLRENAFDLLITCVPPGEIKKVYPHERVGDIRFIHALTGYVSPFLRTFEPPSNERRDIDVSYRGSIQPLSTGRLGMEKRKIGYDVVAACAGGSLQLDISSRWEDRISGTAWFDFLARSKAVLGVESGSNLFDFTGEVEHWCDEFCRKNRIQDHTAEQFYQVAHCQYLKDFEGNVNYAQISPRHFEAAATRTLQILYEGEYSGILKPFRHFIPLRRDLSNLDETLDIARDHRRRAEITEAAYEEIVRDPRYRYEAFVSRVDEAIGVALATKGGATRARRFPLEARPRALVLVPHEPTSDPRIDWMANRLSHEYETCEIGVRDGAGRPSVDVLSDHRYRVRIDRACHDWDWVKAPRDLGHSQSLAADELTLLFMYAYLPHRALCSAIGALDADPSALFRFRALCNYIINTNSSLIQAARLVGAFDVIVAADLETLPAALIIGEENNAMVVYDAHEYWPYSRAEFLHWEVEFWSGLERTLASQAAIRVTVSPPLAAALSEEYGCEFISVGNCAPLAAASAIDVPARLRERAAQEEFIFLYQGLFAPGRGIEHLIRAWVGVSAPARLLLRGPDDGFKAQMEDLAESLGLKGKRVFFPEPVGEGKLIAAAAEADVGIIPYEPRDVNNRFSCPNKLSQYLAAGLPVISNDLAFIKTVLLDNEIGAVVDFRDAKLLARTIDRFSSRLTLAQMSLRAQRFFQSTFHWEKASDVLFDRIRKEIAAGEAIKEAGLDFSWIEGGEMQISADEGLEFPLPASITMRSLVRTATTKEWRAVLLRLIANGRARRAARSVLSLLPEDAAFAVKAKVVSALRCLH